MPTSARALSGPLSHLSEGAGTARHGSLEAERRACLQQRALARGFDTERQGGAMIQHRQPDSSAAATVPAARGVPVEVDAAGTEVAVDSPDGGDGQVAVTGRQTELRAAVDTRIPGEPVRVIPGQGG